MDEKEGEETFRTNRKWSEFVKGEREEAFSSALGIKTVSQAYPGFLPSLASALSSSQDRFQTNFAGK